MDNYAYVTWGTTRTSLLYDANYSISGICAAFQFMNSAQDYEMLCAV